MDRKQKLVLANLVAWLLTGVYTVSPIDLIPDFIPVVGWMDDLGTWLVTIAFTLYTLNVLRKEGLSGLLSFVPQARPSTARGEMFSHPAVEPEVYEPVDVARIKAL